MSHHLYHLMISMASIVNPTPYAFFSVPHCSIPPLLYWRYFACVSFIIQGSHITPLYHTGILHMRIYESDGGVQLSGEEEQRLEQAVKDKKKELLMYATGGEKCPIALFKKYISLRPPRTQKPDSPFYLLSANTSTATSWCQYIE